MSITLKNRMLHFAYLDRLRRSGATNMNAAAPFLAVTFGLGKVEAVQILNQWKDTFDEKLEPAARAAKAITA